MQFLGALPVTRVGTIEFLPEEVVHASADSVTLYDGERKAPAYTYGTATVTTHRLCWMDTDRARPRACM